MKSDIIQILPYFDLVSFDIFDTLLLRPFVKPTDLFYKMEYDEEAKGFAEARTEGEKRAHAKARANGRAEATFDEIYAEIPQWTEMKEKELATERMCLTINPEIVEVWNAAKAMGKKVIIASDMYLPMKYLQAVLREKGIDGWDGFFLSNEIGAQKWTGTLFQEILSEFGVVSDKVLHIGDDDHSDVKMANAQGIVAYGYQKIINKFFEELPFIKHFLENDELPRTRLLVGALALGWHLYKYEHPAWTYWNRLGYLFAGPLGYAYMRFVGENARIRGIDHLMFVARDGYILQKIFNILYPNVRTDYFYASRAQAFLGIKYFGKTEVGMRARRRYCLKYIEKELGQVLNDEQKDRYESTGELPPNAREVLETVALRMQKEAKAYLAKFDIESDKTAIVDGDSTHFTVQKFVSSIIGHDIFTYYLFTNLPVENGATMACADWDMRYQNFAEFLFGAPTPPVDDIVEGKVLYKHDVPFFEKFKMDVSSAITDGAVASARVLNTFSVEFNHDMWLDWNDSFMDNMSVPDVEMFTLARNSISIGHETEYHPIIKPSEKPSRKTILGKTLFLAKTFRRGVTRRRVLLLFGKIPIIELSLADWRKIAMTFR